jgi:thiamine biosynthesis lipoprotein
MKVKSILGLLILFNISCSSDVHNDLNDEGLEIVSSKRIELFGNTQGTTYAVIVNDQIELSHKEIDETLHQFDLALSSYIPNSILSKLNNYSAGTFKYKDSLNFFNRCIEQSRFVYELSSGNFDPTVYPLVDGWGFMKNIEQVPDSMTVDSLRGLIGFRDGYHFKFNVKGKDSLCRIIKYTPNAKLDFNALAQGLSVDVICELLEEKGAQNYFVEIGGEVRVKGLNSEGVLWTIGIDQPVEKSSALNRVLQEIVQLDNKSIATSGSYRKFYEKDGIKYSHTLNPRTGYPVKHSLLSVTVVADNCALADGLATAFMVMGTENTIKFIKLNKDLDIDIFLIFQNVKGRQETYMSKGFKSIILK